MATISIRTSESEKDLIQCYAEFFGLSMSEFIRQAVLDKIEDILDREDFVSYLQEPYKDPAGLFNHPKLLKSLDLE